MDIVYPETEKLIKIGKIFGCSMDYLLNDCVIDKNAAKAEPGKSIFDKIKKQFRERKSKKTVFGMPLYHIGRDARGFFAIGLKAKGVFAFGLMSRGVLSVGLLSLGAFSLGLFSLGIMAFGTFAAGLLAVGAIALGIIAAGAISVGVLSFGALSIGCFSAGALAVGKYIAVGDHAYAMISIGKSFAQGSEYSVVGVADVNYVCAMLDSLVPEWLSWAKEIFKFFLR